jgi:hypothetical protein
MGSISPSGARAHILRGVENEKRILWTIWAVLFATLALYFAIPRFLPPRPQTWNAGETAVASLVTALFALAASVGTFAIRESLARRHLRSGAIDLGTEGGRSRLRSAFLGAWALCDGIGVLGLGLALASGDATLVTPYIVGAAALFVLHRPTAWLLGQPPA